MWAAGEPLLALLRHRRRARSVQMMRAAGVAAWAATAMVIHLSTAAPAVEEHQEEVVEEWEPRASSGCGRAPPQHVPDWPGWFKFQLQDPVVGQLERWWVMHIPEGYDPRVPIPLVIDIHGFSSNAAEQSERTWVSRVADREGFIVAYPDGIDDAFSSDGSGEKGWNAGGTVSSPGLLGPTCAWADNTSEYSCYRSCKFGPGHSPPGAGHNCFQNQRVLAKGCDSTSCVDDQYFLEQLMGTLLESYCIERRRIHVTGFSNGAMMTYQLAMESKIADQIASIAPVAGSPLLGFLYDAAGRPRMQYPMGVLDMKGTEDDTIPANISNGDGGRPGAPPLPWPAQQRQPHERIVLKLH